jgi:hypothetical protein
MRQSPKTATRDARRASYPERQRLPRWLLLLLVLVLPAGTLPIQRAVAATPRIFGGKSKQRNEAVERIPMNRLDADARKKVMGVINHTSVFRRMTPQVIDCDPRYYMFLIRHPEVIVNIWQLMDATDMSISRKGPVRFSATDGAGTVGDLEFLYGDEHVHVLFARGSYTGSLTKRPIRADCLLVIHSNFVANNSGRPFVRTNMDLFIDVKNVGVDLIARTFQSMIGNTTDQNFIETANFVTKLSRTTENNGPGMQHLAGRLTEVDEKTRREFARHVGEVYQRAVARHQASKRFRSTLVKGASPLLDDRVSLQPATSATAR